MKINFVLSNTTKRATTVALECAAKIAADSFYNNVLVIVPETKSIIIERELLKLTKNGATANIYVYSFVRLLSRIWKIKDETVLNKQACVVLLRKIILEQAHQFTCYKKSAKSLGFAEKMYDTIAQFKSSGITPDDIEVLISSGTNNALKNKLSDILLIFREYEQRLGEKLFDDCDRLNMINSLAKNSNLIKSSKIFIVGFDNITPQMQSVIKTLAGTAEEITFSCPYFHPERGDSYLYNNELYKKFTHIAEELKMPYVPNFYKSFESGDFYNIANSLFLLGKKQVKPKGDVKIFEAANKKQEIEFVASTILNEVKCGKRFKDIGLYVCGLESNYPLIEECFKQYDIPFFINRQHEISGHFLIKFISSAFAMYKSYLNSSDVLSFVLNPLFNLQDAGAFITFVNASGINHSAFFNEPHFEFDNLETKQAVEEALIKLQEFVKPFFDKLKTASKVNEYIDVLNFLFEKFDVKNQLAELANNLSAEGEEIEAEICRVVFDKQQKFVQTLINFMGDSVLSASEFIQIYLSGLGSIKLNLSPVSIDCVIVQDNTDGFFDIKDLFIFDAVTGKFPIKAEDKGIILDDEIDSVEKIINKALEPTIGTINRRENFKAYEALLEPQEKLFVSYSLKAEGGAATKPSRMVLRLIDLFGEDIILKNAFDCGFINFKKEEFILAKKIGKFFETGYGLNEINNSLSKITLSDKFSEHLNSLKFGIQRFELDSTDGLYFYDNSTSVTQLETYFACPYEFFAKYGLRIKENKQAKMNALDVGNIVHLVVEIFGKRINEFIDLSEEEFINKINEILLVAIVEQKIDTNGNATVLKLIRNECINLCKNIVLEQQTSSYKINKTEFKFEKANAVVLELSGGKSLLLQGKIDRLDKFGNKLRIIDYKTGDVSVNLSNIYYGKKVQLASYLEAATKFDSGKVAGLLYLPVHSNFEEDEKYADSHYKMKGFLLDDIDALKYMDSSLAKETPTSRFIPLKVKFNDNGEICISKMGKVQDKFLTSAEFDAVNSYVHKLICTAAEEILSGYIEPSPMISSLNNNQMRCDYCKFAGFCGLENAKFSGGRLCAAVVDINSFNSENENSESADSINQEGGDSHD